MKILLTNDDGIGAVGLETLRRAVRGLPEVQDLWVVAPRDPQSGVSHRVTTDGPIATDFVDERTVGVAGTPCDCVRIALKTFAADCDWVFSGINDGGNLGVDIHMSGTVAACREGALLGKPGVAWSQYVRRPGATNWEAAARMVTSTWRRLQKHGLPRGGFWNVNFPHGPDPRRLPDPVLCAPDPAPLPVTYVNEGDSFHYVGDYGGRPQTPGRDVAICFGGGVAITKLTADWG